ncbi:MAG: peptidase c1a, papain [Myxococcales bacterium]|nr:peptidase c1a, papain [Myxococcota bacterium]MDW8283522.1 peptidase c1a, papain [Myxococcales bacterium]
MRALPQRVQLYHPFAPRAQAQVPCCVSAALVVCMEALLARLAAPRRLSVLYHYFVARAGSPELLPIDFVSALHAASMSGVCREALFAPPFTPEGARQTPPPAADRDAARQRLLLHDERDGTVLCRPLESDALEEWRAALAAGYPILLGFWTTPAYWRLRAGGRVHPPISTDERGDGHAVAVLGYDDHAFGGALHIKDSRGAGFASGGCWYLPYELLAYGPFDEAYALMRVECK